MSKLIGVVVLVLGFVWFAKSMHEDDMTMVRSLAPGVSVPGVR